MSLRPCAHICVRKLSNIGSDNGLSPVRRQVIIGTNAGMLFMGNLGTNISDIFIAIGTFSFTKCIWKCRLRKMVAILFSPLCVNGVNPTYPYAFVCHQMSFTCSDLCELGMINHVIALIISFQSHGKQVQEVCQEQVRIGVLSTMMLCNLHKAVFYGGLFHEKCAPRTKCPTSGVCRNI